MFSSILVFDIQMRAEQGQKQQKAEDDHDMLKKKDFNCIKVEVSRNGNVFFFQISLMYPVYQLIIKI